MDVLVVGHKTHKLFQEITFFYFSYVGTTFRKQARM